MYSEIDLSQLRKKGLGPETVNQQIKYFEEGIDFVEIVAPAIPGKGISVFSEEEISKYLRFFDNNILDYSFTRFIPASGAASRMFKDLFETLEYLSNIGKAEDLYEKKPNIAKFFNSLNEYPFHNDLKQFFNKEIVGADQKTEVLIEILEKILLSEGLNYSSLPKGLLKFHKYNGDARTAFEEHFMEAKQYLLNEKLELNLHFTVSPEHKDLFMDLSGKIKAKFKSEYAISCNTEFSVQKPSTDTVAVDKNNNIFRNDDGSMLFRPGGHGALLENLNDLKEQIVFIGNIDNIAPERTMPERIKYKKLLGGVLMEKMGKVHHILSNLDNYEKDSVIKNEILEIIRELAPESETDIYNLSIQDFKVKILELLNRPIRICGMVKNVGEPGGGPFWVKNKKAEVSKQIIESSQINLQDTEQNKLFQAATHFNPVDLACYTHDYQGNKFDLIKFRDPDMGFISVKSQGGKELKALELPGLWNGSMAAWLTWFVEVPIETFTPVKTVFDLVRDAHRS
ncbi:MAG: DUF4301 family protein [Bacteroidales bacterium]|nr:DUF4301 family protein [Bacteroidales bacterium]MCF8390379.1 DUF4301 family protein [Bacteroidales bacterium]